MRAQFEHSQVDPSLRLPTHLQERINIPILVIKRRGSGNDKYDRRKNGARIGGDMLTPGANHGPRGCSSSVLARHRRTQSGLEPTWSPHRVIIKSKLH